MIEDRVVLEAKFDPRVKTYWFVSTLLVMLVTVVGIPLIPVWLLGWGKWYVDNAYDRLYCALTSRSLLVRKGIWFRVEKTIPLDKVQDLALHQGPLMRMYDIHSLRVETAGQSSPQGTSEAQLPGIVAARDFREAVRRTRDERTLTSAAETVPPANSPALPLSAMGLLEEIRDSLKRIETHLDRRSGP